MTHAMISAVALLVGTVILLFEAVIDRTGGPRFRVEKAIHRWLPPFGWSALVVSAIFAIMAAAE